MKLYIGCIDAGVTSEQLRSLFEPFGVVTKAAVHIVGGTSAFGRVEMPDAVEGRNAIDHLDGTDHQGKRLTVNECSDNFMMNMADDFEDDDYC